MVCIENNSNQTKTFPIRLDKDISNDHKSRMIKNFAKKLTNEIPELKLKITNY